MHLVQYVNSSHFKYEEECLWLGNIQYVCFKHYDKKTYFPQIVKHSILYNATSGTKQGVLCSKSARSFQVITGYQCSISIELSNADFNWEAS